MRHAQSGSSGALSATIVSPDTTLADALSKPALILVRSRFHRVRDR
jgi:hypothetical protein